MMYRPTPDQLLRLHRASDFNQEVLKEDAADTAWNRGAEADFVRRLDKLMICAYNQSRNHMIATPEHSQLVHLVASMADAWLALGEELRNEEGGSRVAASVSENGTADRHS